MHLPSQTTLLMRYHYDPLDRLVACDPANAPDQQRFYLQDRLASEIQGALRHSIFQHNDLLLAQQQHQESTTETALLATDLQRSIMQTLDKGQRQAMAYSPYGYRIPGNGLLSLLGFNGERADQLTGHYLLGNGYRAFNPVLMRFNSPDSWSPFGKGGFNTYAYCNGDPTSHRDDTGHSPSLSWISTIGSTSLDISRATRFSTRRLWQKTYQYFSADENTARALVQKSMNHYQPTTKRLLASADNALEHAKIIGYNGDEIAPLKEAQNTLLTHIKNKEKIIDLLLENISYDSISISTSKSSLNSAPANRTAPAHQLARDKYEAQYEYNSFNIAFRTYELNKKLLQRLNVTSTAIRKNN